MKAEAQNEERKDTKRMEDEVEKNVEAKATKKIQKMEKLKDLNMEKPDPKEYGFPV